MHGSMSRKQNQEMIRTAARSAKQRQKQSGSKKLCAKAAQAETEKQKRDHDDEMEWAEVGKKARASARVT
jgi:hypothetical protein